MVKAREPRPSSGRGSLRTEPHVHINDTAATVHRRRTGLAHGPAGRDWRTHLEEGSHFIDFSPSFF